MHCNISNHLVLTKQGGREKYEHDLKKSATLYVGNLSFFTSEEQLYELFSKCGDIKRVIMGLNKINMTPCGFCFVEYHLRDHARDAMRYINGTRLDDRLIRTDWDPGFQPGRQYGRGSSGGQVRDDFRMDFDEARGGFGGKMTQNYNRIQDLPTETRPRRDSDRAPRRELSTSTTSTPKGSLKSENEGNTPKKRKMEESDEEDDD